MTKNQIIHRINVLKAERSALRSKKEECTKNINALEEFSHNVNGYVNNFFDSINMRKSRFQGLSSLIGSVKAIDSYCNRLHGVLNGQEFHNVVSSIEQMKKDVSNKLSACSSEAASYERRINAINQEIRNLQIEYNKAEEENG